MTTKVGSQSSAANNWSCTVPNFMTPSQRMTIGPRYTPSHASPFGPLNGVALAAGKVIVSATVVGGEHHDRVVGLPHVVELLEHETDVVVELLHTCFLDAPVLTATAHAQHFFIFRRGHS